jgi:DNA-binding NtrC family response regulator
LYYRLRVFDICIPPRRDRSSDIPLLEKPFLEEIANSIGCRTEVVSAEAMAILMTYRWPGNVRELRNVLEPAAILCEGGSIMPDHLSLRLHVADTASVDAAILHPRPNGSIVHPSPAGVTRSGRSSAR